MLDRLYLFNPEHDMALAAESKFYMTPAHICRMKADLAMLPLWYAGAECRRCTIMTFSAENESSSRDFLKSVMGYGLPIPEVTLLHSFTGDYSSVVPWGWDAALLHSIDIAPIEIASVPGDDDIKLIRDLSSRIQAVKLLTVYNEINATAPQHPMACSLFLGSIEEVERYLAQRGCIMLKAPWSGSGRGVRKINSALSNADVGWTSRILRTQGGVVVEPYYNKVVDFAMEFDYRDSLAHFAGYSVFQTDDNGAYKCNTLDSDEALERLLCKYVSMEELQSVKEEMASLLTSQFAASYTGVLGVDMMICASGSGYWVHPCVEVNLRMNMGVVARRLYDNFISAGSHGDFYVEHFFAKDEAIKNDELMKSRYPLVLEHGRIASGYFSLTPVNAETLFQAFVIVAGK